MFSDSSSSEITHMPHYFGIKIIGTRKFCQQCSPVFQEFPADTSNISVLIHSMENEEIFQNYFWL